MHVSVVVPTYNRASLHPQLYNVFLAQTHHIKDLWVYDDSPAPSWFFGQLYDPRVHYLWAPERLSIGAKRNLLVRHARGDVLCQFDDDDLYARDYIDKMLDRLMGSDLAKLVVWDAASPDGACWRWDTRATAGECFEVTGGSAPKRIVNCAEDKDAREAALLGYGFSYVYTREAWARIGGFRDMNAGEDIDFVRRLGDAGGKVAFVDDMPDSVLHYLHPQSTSRIYPQAQLSGPAVFDVEQAQRNKAKRITIKAGKRYRIVALVKDTHGDGAIIRRAREYVEVEALQEVGSGKPHYRRIEATVRAVRTASLPSAVPPPFSVMDKSEILHVTPLGG